MTHDNPLIEPEELFALLSHGAGRDIVILDATYAINPDGSSAQDNWRLYRIGNAQFFDIDLIADPHSHLPHMLPPPDAFAHAASVLGIGDDTLVVVYDQTGIAMAACRVWWMLRVFGHDHVRVLNGGLPAWHAAGLPLQTTPPALPDKMVSFTRRFRPELVVSKDDILNTLSSADNETAQHAHIIDARAAGRFQGLAPEPRAGLRAGHIPHSHNLPFTAMIDPQSGKMIAPAQIAPLLAPHNAAPAIISSCGSGVTACVLALALYRQGRKDVAVYDGSWVEWGSTDENTPVATRATIP